jgi:hypothetical protein
VIHGMLGARCGTTVEQDCARYGARNQVRGIHAIF